MKSTTRIFPTGLQNLRTLPLETLSVEFGPNGHARMLQLCRDGNARNKEGLTRDTTAISTSCEMLVAPY